jgi:hypothetical protein
MADRGPRYGDDTKLSTNSPKGEEKMKNRRVYLIISLIFVLILIGVVAVGGGFLRRNASRGTAGVVVIQSPSNGALAEVNQTLPLIVAARADRPIRRLEVYADGGLIASADGPQKALTLAQLWAFPTPGRHVLLARAFFAPRDFADSAVTFVDVVDLSGVPVRVNVDDLPRGEG